MKTITKTYNVYSFDELSNKAKQTAIDNYRYKDMDTSHVYDEAYETIKAFHEVFGTKEGRRSQWNVNTDHIEETICNMKGLRLRTYLINNFWNKIYKGKYYSLWSKVEFPFNKAHGKPYPALKTRYSKVMFTKDCPLTGVCYDYSILNPIYDFIDSYTEEKYSHVTFDMLMNDCIQSLERDVENEIESMNEDEYIIEQIEDNDYKFTEDGKLA